MLCSPLPQVMLCCSHLAGLGNCTVTMALPKVTYVDFEGGCTWARSRDEWLSFLVPAFLVYYVAPLLCIAVKPNIIAHLHGCTSSLTANRRNKKATALLIASTLVFAISWLPYYALEFVNVMSPYVSTAASPVSTPGRDLSSMASSTSASPSEEAKTKVSLLWEVASLAAILLVCLDPWWNPPLYFLLSCPAVRQLRALMPSFLHKRLGKNLCSAGVLLLLLSQACHTLIPRTLTYSPNTDTQADCVGEWCKGREGAPRGCAGNRKVTAGLFQGAEGCLQSHIS
ncbi:LOW QUALITY PROTEIN: uncharacterized protein LOC144405483 [Gasterosteus aculeatus]